jgi:hypothetical protein
MGEHSPKSKYRDRGNRDPELGKITFQKGLDEQASPAEAVPDCPSQIRKRVASTQPVSRKSVLSQFAKAESG